MADHADEVLARIRSGLLCTESEAAFQGPLRRGDLIFEYNGTPPDDTGRAVIPPRGEGNWYGGLDRHMSLNG